MDDLTPQLNEKQLKENIDALLKQGKDTNFVQGYVNNYRKNNEGNYVLLSEMKKGFGKRISEDLGKRQENINQVQDLRAEGETGIGEAIQMVAPKLGAKVEEFTRKHPKISSMVTNLSGGDIVAGQLAGGVQDIIGETLSAITPKKWKEWGAEKAQQFAKTALAQAGIKTAEQYADWAEKYPLLAKKLEGNLNLALTAADLVGAGEAATAIGQAAKRTRTVIEDTAKTLTKSAKEKGKDLIDKGSKVFDRSTAEQKSLKSTLDQDLIDKKTMDIPNEQKGIPEYPNYVKEAQKQGIADKDINFVASLKDADKPFARKMYDFAVKADKDVRAIDRPMDVVGDNGVELLKGVQKKNMEAGKLVDETARSLAGQTIDATKVKQTATSALERAGVVFKENGIPDFRKSIFKKTQALQKQIMNAFSDLPDGIIDAYDLHKFKKSIDQIVEFGKTSQKGITRDAEKILKSVRNAADDVLDSTFEAYNKANSDYKFTKEMLDQAHSVIGKKVDFITKGANQKFGQAMRGAFSNSKSRADILKFIENLQNTAQKYGVGNERNLLDQALFAQVLEEVFGSQAVTGLTGEVSKAIKTATRGIDIVRDPIKGVPNLLADAYEKTRNITPEAKKAALRSLLK